MHLGIFTRGPLNSAKRVQLPMLSENRLRRAFNLKRALLTATIPINGSPKPLAIAVTHLSAFSYGDGTLERQVAKLDEWMGQHDPDQPWILAGDMNMLPPGDDPDRLGEVEAVAYADEKNPLEAIIPKYKTVFTKLLSPESYTYLPFIAKAPDRKIDYIFYGGPIDVVSTHIGKEHLPLSDHLPLVVEFVVKPPSKP